MKLPLLTRLLKRPLLRRPQWTLKRPLPKHLSKLKPPLLKLKRPLPSNPGFGTKNRPYGRFFYA